MYKASSLRSQAGFLKLLVLERRRAERSRRHLLVMVIDVTFGHRHYSTIDTINLIDKNLIKCLRDTDIWGFLKEDALIGVILTDIDSDKIDAAKRITANKARVSLTTVFGADVTSRIYVNFRIYPPLSEGGNQTFHSIFPECGET
jgi:hypothetical protein